MRMRSWIRLRKILPVQDWSITYINLTSEDQSLQTSVWGDGSLTKKLEFGGYVQLIRIAYGIIGKSNL